MKNELSTPLSTIREAQQIAQKMENWTADPSEEVADSVLDTRNRVLALLSHAELLLTIEEHD